MLPSAEEIHLSTPLPIALAALRRRRATGVLRATVGEVCRELVLVDGELRAARSTAEEERLGSWLVGRQKLREGDRRVLLQARGHVQESPFGHVLVTRGLLTEEQLTGELAALTRTIIERATVADQPRLEFDDGARSHHPDTLPDDTTCELILHASRVLPNLRAKRAAIPADSATIWRSAPMDILLQGFQLTVHEKILIGKLHRERTVEQLREMTQLPEHVFVASLFALLQADIVSTSRHDDAAADLASPAAAAPRGFSLATETADSTRTLVEIAADHRGFRDKVRQLSARLGSLNHYQLLELQSDATYQQVFDAWDAFQRRFDPARARAEVLADLAEPLRRLSEHGRDAFEVLSSPARRPRYDSMLRADEVTNGATGETAPGPPAAPAPGAAPTATPSAASVVEANLDRVEQLRRGGDLFSAIRLLEQTADLDRSPDILLRLARLMLLNPHWANRALEKLRLAVEIDPGFVDGWLEVAEFWRRRQAPERQRKALERALVAAPDHAGAADQYRRVAGDEALAELLDRVRRRQ